MPQQLSEVHCAARQSGARTRRARKALPGGGTALLFAVLCLIDPLCAHAQSTEQIGGVGPSTQRAPARKATKPVPAPPRRPQQHPPATATPPKAPVQTPARPPEPSAPKLAPPVLLTPVDPTTPPPVLPRASRQTMHRCALEWEKMKREGHVGAPMWREFATQCLTK